MEMEKEDGNGNEISFSRRNHSTGKEKIMTDNCPCGSTKFLSSHSYYYYVWVITTESPTVFLIYFRA